jgi:ferredoxin-NADP reductase
MSSATQSPSPVVTLASRREIAVRTLEFEITRPGGFQFKAGQTVDLTWINPPETDSEGDTRTFSIASAPDDPQLLFATRLRDTAFKRILESAPLGAALRMEGPFGNLTLHNNASRPAILIAGGIGITPFRSIVRRAAHEKLPHRILLFYANKSTESAAFLEEFEAIRKDNPNFTFIPTMGNPSPSWHGETGRISAEMLIRHLNSTASPNVHAASPIYYVAGPPAMVTGIRSVLNNAGIDDDDVRSEEFSGY